MKKKLLALLTTVFVGASAYALASCKDDENSSSSTPPSSEQTESFANLSDMTIGFGDLRGLKATGENLVWSSSNPLVATVNENGEIFGCGLGETTVSVSNGVETASCKVTVIQSLNVPTCLLDPSYRYLTIGATNTLEPKVLVSDVEIKGVTYTYESEDTSIATVDTNGVITAVALGETKISVSYSAGGYFDTVKIPVVVAEDIVFELNQKSVTLALEEVENGQYLSSANLEIVRLLLNNEPVDFSEVNFEIADESLINFQDGVITPKKVGNTQITATYQTDTTVITVTVPVTVLKNTLMVLENSSINATWDIVSESPVEYSYIELPYSVQIADDEVVRITDSKGNVLSENNGLTVPKTRLTEKEISVNIETKTLVYQTKLAVDATYFHITDYQNQFSGAVGVRAKAYEGEMDGRTDVLYTQSGTTTNVDGISGVWYHHCGDLLLNKYARSSWVNGVLMYEIKAEEGTPIGGYYNVTYFLLDQETGKFKASDGDHAQIKIVDKNFEETTFKYGEWNTVVIDYTSETDIDPNFLPSFTNAEVTQTYEAYYSNFRYMSKDTYNQLRQPTEEKKYTVSFDMGNVGLSVPSQQLPFRSTVDVSNISSEYEIIGWMVGDKFVDVDKLYVTDDVTLLAVYDKNYQYTVYYLQQQINGAYLIVEEDTLVSEGRINTEVSAENKTYEGYVLNENLSVTSGKILVNDRLVLVCYYDNPAYTYENTVEWTTGSVSATHSQERMQNVPATDLRENTHKVFKKSASGHENLFIPYEETDIGKYLVLNVYYTDIPTGNPGLQFWNGNYTATIAMPMLYNQDGTFFDFSTYYAGGMLNKWVSVVLYLDEAVFPADAKHGDRVRRIPVGIVQNSTSTVYFGDYVFLTEAEYQSYFEQFTTDIPEGVTQYLGSEMQDMIGQDGLKTIAYKGNGLSQTLNVTKDHWQYCVSIKGVTGYTAGQYVGIRVKSNFNGRPFSLYNHQTAFGTLTEYVFDETDGVRISADAMQAGKWYTMLWKVEKTSDVERFKGEFMTQGSGVRSISHAYVIEDDTAFESFKTWKGWNA